MTPSASHHLSESLGLWEPKRTLTLEAARRHSRRIRLFRKLLIMVALSLLIVLIWQFTKQANTNFPEDNSNEAVKMINPRYSGRTQDGLPFYLTANEAVRTIDNDNAVDLLRPVMEFFRNEQAEQSTITAKSGTYDDVAKILNLYMDVELNTDDGYSCKTTHARIYTQSKIVEGDEPISCTGTFGDVHGNRYEILDNYKTFVFKDGMDARIAQE